MKELGAEKWGCNANGGCSWVGHRVQLPAWLRAIPVGAPGVKRLAGCLVGLCSYQWSPFPNPGPHPASPFPNPWSGDAWRETWKETISVDPVTGQPSVARSAHKWANNAAGDEWEEKWDEGYLSKGAASKSASKWARQGAEVWHEEWGEDYDGAGRKWGGTWARDGRLEGDGGRRRCIADRSGVARG